MKKDFLKQFELTALSRQMMMSVIGGNQTCCWAGSTVCISCNGGTCSGGSGCIRCTGGEGDGNYNCIA